MVIMPVVMAIYEVRVPSKVVVFKGTEKPGEIPAGENYFFICI